MQQAILSFNKIDILCLITLFVIKKIVCPEQYDKRLIVTKSNRLAAFYS